MEGVDGELGPTVDDLVDVARRAGAARASRRTINYWAGKGDVSRPRQVGREWRYPNVAVGQVDTVARLRKLGVRSAVIRFALFIETGAVQPDEALSLARDLFAEWQEALEREGTRLRDDPDALVQEASTAARMRGRAPLPHRVRGVSFEARTQAMTLVIARLFSVPISPTEADVGLHNLERILGLRGGRGGTNRDLEDITVQPDDWPADAGKLRAALDSATPERVELARRGVEFAVAWMPAMSATLTATFGPSLAPLADILEEWAAKLTPDAYVLMFATFLRNGLGRASDREIEEALQVFMPALGAAGVLRERPTHEQSTFSRKLRPYQRLQFERALAEPPAARK